MKTRNIHDEIEEWMAGALCGGLSTEEESFFNQHLATCQSCRALFLEEQHMSKLLEQEMTRQRPEPEFGDRMVNQFRERVAKPERGPGLFWSLGRLAWSRPMQGFYAVLLLAAMVQTGAMLTGEYPAAISRFDKFAGAPPLRGEFKLEGREKAREADAQKMVDEAPNQPREYDYNPNSNYMQFAQRRAISLGGAAKSAEDSLGAGTSLADADVKTLNRERAQIAAARLPMSTLDVQTKDAVPAMPATSAMSADASGGGANMPAGVSGMNAYAAAAPELPAPSSLVPAPAQADSTAPPTEDQRKLIRNASVLYEVPDFTKASDMIAGIIANMQGFVASQNSDRGANGKMEGTIVAKVPPQSLDAFLQKLHELGDLKNQNISTDDVTKDYFDTEARVHNALIEEQRLQQLLTTNTDHLDQLLEVERELARVRQSIEEMQGTLKYYNTMIQFATVTISLSEKEMHAAASFLLRQSDELSLFSGDVEGTIAKAKQIAAAAKAQVVDSRVSRDSGGNTTARLNLLIDPDQADATIAQLKALGRIQTFNSQTERVAQGGTDATIPARTDTDKVSASLTVQQDQEDAVQQTNVNVETKEVEAKLNDLKAKAKDLGATVKGANFQQDPGGSSSATVQLRMPLGNYAAVLAMVKGLGDVKNLSVNRQEGATVNDSAPAEMTVQIDSPQQIVTPDNGLWATTRETLGQAFGAVMWSLRMIGVSLAFFGPWVVAIVIVVWAVKTVRRLRRKS
jgi:hypothetical protein